MIVDVDGHAIIDALNPCPSLDATDRHIPSPTKLVFLEHLEY